DAAVPQHEIEWRAFECRHRDPVEDGLTRQWLDLRHEARLWRVRRKSRPDLRDAVDTLPRHCGAKLRDASELQRHRHEATEEHAIAPGPRSFENFDDSRCRLLPSRQL